MDFLESNIGLLFPSYEVVDSKENVEIFEIDLRSKNFDNIESNILRGTFSFLQERDALICTVTFGSSDPIILNSSADNYDEFCEALNDEYTHLDEGEFITIRVTITKAIEEGFCTIYNLETFVATLEILSPGEFLHIFSRIFSLYDIINFKVLNGTGIICSASVSFSPIDNDSGRLLSSKRKDIFDGFKSVCSFGSVDSFYIIPADLRLKSSDVNYDSLKKLFDRYAHLLAIIFNFDITTLFGSEIEFKLNGYKSIKGRDLVGKLSDDAFQEYYDIYSWVYTGGNLSDKIGLARNIISLHFQKIGHLELSGHPLQSIKSSYKIYEKQNIKQYIEVRNKISDQLLAFNDRASKIVESFASGFQKSTLALISFFLSAIVIRVLSKGDFTNIFSLDATILSLTFIAGSLIYYFVSKWEIKEQRKRFANSYSNLKERYQDLLEPEDIRRILNDDKEYLQDIDFIDRKTKAYSRMWIIVLAILGLSTLILFFTYNISKITTTAMVGLIIGKPCD